MNTFPAAGSGAGDGISEAWVLRGGDVIVRVDPHYFRRTEVDTLLGDPGTAIHTLGWKPKVTFSGAGFRYGAIRPSPCPEGASYATGWA